MLLVGTALIARGSEHNIAMIMLFILGVNRPHPKDLAPFSE